MRTSSRRPASSIRAGPSPIFQLADINPAIDKEHLEATRRAAEEGRRLDPRNIDYWPALAKNDVAAKDFTEAQKAWGGAEHAAANDEERERIHQVVCRCRRTVSMPRRPSASVSQTSAKPISSA